MAIASSNAMSLRYAPVSAFDAAMESAAYRVLPVNADGLTYDKRTVESQRIRSDYGVHSIVEVGAGGGGRLPFELDLLNFSDVLEALCGNTWSGGSPLQPAAAPTGTGGTLTNGTLEKYLDIEVAQTDLINEFKHHPSHRPGQMTLNFQPEAIVTGDITFFGHSMAIAAATVATSVVNEISSAAAPVVNATTNVGSVELDDVAIASKIMRISLTLNHNLGPRPAVGEKFSVGVLRGFFQVTGSIELYDEETTRDEVAAFIAHTKKKLDIPLTDAAGNTMTITVPRLAYTGGSPESPGVNQDNRVVLPFSAEHSGSMISFSLTPV